MIRKKDIAEFFELEAIVAKENWDTLMKFPVEQRVRKRRAIKDVYLDRNFRETSKEGHVLLRITTGVNLSDFKEGECVILHIGEYAVGISCVINRFEGEEAIILEVFPPRMPSNLEPYYNVPLMLDRDLLDLRQHVFYPFLTSLSPDIDENSWISRILNKKTTPVFTSNVGIEEGLEDMTQFLGINLLPNQRESIYRSLSADDYYLIQGPPGTGKSFVLAFIIMMEIVYFKHKVIAIGPNHMAINNTLIAFLKAFPELSQVIYKVGQSYNSPTAKVESNGEVHTIKNFMSIDGYSAYATDGGWLVGLTPHSLYTSRASTLKCDTLIIDEAGQVTIPLALMGMMKANKVILAGDHKQLPPIISSDKIKGEMQKSIFQTLMTEDNCTMLNVSFRMCGPICDFVSELFYDGKIKSMKPECGDMIVCKEPLFDFNTPIVIHQIDDYGEQISDKEAAFIAETIAGFIKKGLPANEVAVLSPFRAQAINIQRHIRKCKDISEEQHGCITSDTIDKMQGQEREVIIYSLVSGDVEYMTEMAEFLYNPKKMNVAFSRAKSKLIIVGNIEHIKTMNPTGYPHLNKMFTSKYVHFV